jgi:hypothetical protein
MTNLWDKKLSAMQHGTKSGHRAMQHSAKPGLHAMLHSAESFLYFSVAEMIFTSVAEPHHFYAAPALSKIFDAGPASTLLCIARQNFQKKLKFNHIMKLSCILLNW